MALQGGEPGAMSRAVQAQAGQPPPSEVDRLDAVRIERLARIEQCASVWGLGATRTV